NAAMVKQGVENEVGSKKRYEALKEQLKTVEGKLQTLTNSLYVRHPDLAHKRVARTASLGDVGHILPEDTALLDYVVVANDDIRLFIVTKSGGNPRLSVYKVSYSNAPLATDARNLHAICSDPRKPYLLLSRKLYSMLIQPAENVLKGKERLVICPD